MRSNSAQSGRLQICSATALSTSGDGSAYCASSFALAADPTIWPPQEKSIPSGEGDKLHDYRHLLTIGPHGLRYNSRRILSRRRPCRQFRAFALVSTARLAVAASKLQAQNPSETPFVLTWNANSDYSDLLDAYLKKPDVQSITDEALKLLTQAIDENPTA
jgi:hypothetical protein